jgi:hypothetical protein
MSPQMPGLSLSLIRSATSVQAGSPLLISGRFTALGLGVPTFIRVFLEGPDYNPETTHFDTISQPFTGQYNTEVTPAKDGAYQVYAQAFPLPALPSGPLVPETINLLPSIAEVSKLPIVVGVPSAGGVNAQLPSGSQFLQNPTLSPIEISTGAPNINISLPGGGGGVGGGGLISIFAPVTAYKPPAAPPPVTIISQPPVQPPPVIKQPPGVTPPPALPGVPKFKVGDRVTAIPSPSFGPGTVLLVMPVPGSLPNYRVNFDSSGPTSFTTFAEQDLQLSTISQLPSPLPISPPAGLPTAPEPNMLGTPTFGLPSQLTYGSPWTGNISVPTVVPSAMRGMSPLPAFPFNLSLALEDPTSGQRTTVATKAASAALGNALTLPVNFDTKQLSSTGLPKRFTAYLLVSDQQGNALLNTAIGQLYLLISMTVTPAPPPVVIVPPAQPGLNATYHRPSSGSPYVSYAGWGWSPKTQIYLLVYETGGNITLTTDANGNFSGMFNDGDAPGTYSLRAFEMPAATKHVYFGLLIPAITYLVTFTDGSTMTLTQAQLDQANPADIQSYVQNYF